MEDETQPDQKIQNSEAELPGPPGGDALQPSVLQKDTTTRKCHLCPFVGSEYSMLPHINREHKEAGPPGPPDCNALQPSVLQTSHNKEELLIAKAKQYISSLSKTEVASLVERAHKRHRFLDTIEEVSYGIIREHVDEPNEVKVVQQLAAMVSLTIDPSLSLRLVYVMIHQMVEDGVFPRSIVPEKHTPIQADVVHQM